MHFVLIFFCTTAVFSSIFARNGSPASCCLQTSPKRVHLTSILTYREQDKGLCPITAIVFTVENGKVLCSDPASPWTQKAMQKVDEEAERKRNHASEKVPGAPQEGSEGMLTTTMTSRWPQMHASVGMSMGKHRPGSAAKPQRGAKRRTKIIKKKRKGKNKGGKGKRKITKEPAFNRTPSPFNHTSSPFNHTSSPFTTFSYK